MPTKMTMFAPFKSVHTCTVRNDKKLIDQAVLKTKRQAANFISLLCCPKILMNREIVVCVIGIDINKC